MLNEDLLDSVDAANADGDGAAIEPIQVWLALVHHAQIYRFGDGLLSRIRSLIKSLTPPAGTKFIETYATLALCSNVASTQGDVELAEVVVARVMAACEGFADPADVSLAASILVLAAGAAKDRPAGLQWAAERLLQLAYRLPTRRTLRRVGRDHCDLPAAHPP